MPPPRTRGTALRQRLAELRGPDVPAKALDARALAALAANPGCRRRAILDGAGVNKASLASALGSPSAFGQSQFALTRGNAFEKRVKADGGAELLRLVHEKLDRGAEPPSDAEVPELTAIGPEGRTARTALALREATAAGGWTLLDHPMLALDVAGSPAFLEPDAVVVHPDGSWTVVEIKSFPMLDGSADPAKVGAAARQAAVYVLALEEVSARLGAEPEGRAGVEGAWGSPRSSEAESGGARRPEGSSTVVPSTPAEAPRRRSAQNSGPPPRVRHHVLLVCPKDFSNLPTASAVDVRKQRAVTARQLARLTRVQDIADALPEGTCFSPDLPADELTAAVESVPATYAPECLSACELAFHCRDRSRTEGAVTSLGRSVRAELGGLTTVDDVLAAAHGEAGDPEDPAVAALRRAATLRAEALGPRALGAPCR
ncbi:hypothetical protein [Streptomyces sp. NL15-2K]|uniref:hypothetical protein n=1 Tax=Streptomyces sp. NL15-2K TaxID=376149 RepID=UPI000F581127|nr:MULTISPECIES: hypothetical protein [Actinomycetes]WKX09387.1 hypothetical protein Q4V64_18590 [Kutzneria buriramensis]GCB49108.1 hypothetical protein SNL152K_6441 [Streptomyces sp. NL15-2K]